MENKITGDWTKLSCKDIDIPKFMAKLEHMKQGMETECPFCENGKVALRQRKDGSYLYGCDNCDMRIETESKVSE